MEHTTIKEIARSFREALDGLVPSARARLTRMLPRLSRSEPELAAALAEAVREGAGLRGKVFMQAPVDADSRQKLLIESYPAQLPAHPLFAPGISSVLARIVTEWRAAERLRAAGEHPVRSVLLSGPPGVGKTLSAGWLARELDLPLLTLDLATVMSSFLGKSGVNLRMVLDYAQSQPCVLLLDEFDTIAKRRDDDADIGELKRLVTVLLQSIDQWPSHSLLVAATNHGELLDPAVWRRFDVTLEFCLPDAGMRKAFLIDRGVDESLAERLAPVLDRASFSNLERLLRQARKDALLDDIPPNLALLRALRTELQAVSNGAIERDIEILVRHLGGEGSRAIGEVLGISHTTVNRVVKAWLGGKHER